MSKPQKQKEIDKWKVVKAEREKARDARNRWFIPPEEEAEYKRILKES